MDATILSAFVSAVAAITVCLINNHFAQKQIEKKHAENVELITYRLGELEKKMDVHNNTITRMYELEHRTDILEKRANLTETWAKTIDEKIENLERGQSA